ncbi:hypothetical protein [Shimia sp. MIT1388]|uniref:hypothetical protein n=1 Tax=Shimia sp. MIT1388 TaxID=3096992 RepID=UPI00399BA730
MSVFKPSGRSLSPHQLEQKLLQTSSFPNQIAAGSFAPHSTIVEVGCFRTTDVRNALTAKDLMPVRQDIQVLCHEMTHWFDFWGTRWGREYIADICRAYRALERRTEADFPSIIKLFDLDRSVLAPSYYRYTNPPATTHSADVPWSIDYVAGAEIDPFGNTREDRPIFMARFGENPSRSTFARQPVSVGALLEVRAIASEIGAAISAINSHSDQGPRMVEMALANREFNSLAYNHELIEYNAAAHILSVQANTRELFLSARLAAALAYIALNMSQSDFGKLKVPAAFAAFGNRNRAFKKRQDKGYAFAAMVFNGGRYEGDEAEYIKRCVASSNLGTPEGIIEATAGELARPFWFSNGNEITQHFFRETAMSQRIVEAHSNYPQYVLSLQSLITDLRNVAPPFLDSAGEFIELHEGRIGEYDPEAMHDAAHELREYTRNLLTGSRGI